MAVRDGVQGPSGDYPERPYVPDYAANVRLQPAALLSGTLLGAAVGAVAIRLISGAPARSSES